MLWQADWLLSPGGPALRGGWLRSDGDTIAAVGSAADFPGGDARRLEGCVLVPGLINAHCHLELSGLGGKIAPASFPTWVESLRAFTAALDAGAHRAAARSGIGRLLGGGATCVVDVGNTGASLPALARSPLRSFACIEVLGLDPALAETRFAWAREEALRWEKASPRMRTGLAAHAAYSCSPELLALALGFQKGRGPFTFHAAESREEAELFASGAGPLQDYCRRIFPGAPAHRGRTAMGVLDSLAVLPAGALVVHGNLLTGDDISLLARRNAAVVHCPSSHAYFGHPPFPYQALRSAGVPVCLGTDSEASGNSLSMLEQMRLFRRAFPAAPAEEILELATVAPARALGLETEIGSLLPGRKADFLALRCLAAHPADAWEALLDPESRPVLAAIGGEEIPPGDMPFPEQTWGDGGPLYF